MSGTNYFGLGYFGEYFPVESGAAPPVGSVESVVERRGGHRQRLHRYWRGKYAGYFDDIEWTEWLLAAMSGEVEEPPPKPKPIKPTSRKLHRKPPASTADIETAYPDVFAFLMDMQSDEIERLAKPGQPQTVTRLIEAAARKKRRYDEEDDIAFLFMVA